MIRTPGSLRFETSTQVIGGSAGGLDVTGSGALAVIDGHDSIRQSIRMILLTRKGERVMRPGFGANLHELVFAPNNESTAGIAIHMVRHAIAQWEPRAKLLDVDAVFDPYGPGSILHISVRYTMRAGGGEEQIHLSLQLQDGVA